MDDEFDDRDAFEAFVINTDGFTHYQLWQAAARWALAHGKHGWKEIGSAPRDGTVVLLYVPLGEGVGEILTGEWIGEEGIGWADNARGTYWGFEPSLWCEVPPLGFLDDGEVI